MLDSSEDSLNEYELEKALEEAQANEEYKKIIRVALSKWVKNLQEGNILLESVNDLKTLIEAEHLLRRD